MTKEEKQILTGEIFILFRTGIPGSKKQPPGKGADRTHIPDGCRGQVKFCFRKQGEVFI